MSTENEESNTLIYQIINDANNVLHGQAEVFNNMAPYNVNYEYSTSLCPNMIIDQSPLTSSPNPIPDEIPSHQEHMDSIKEADISKDHQIKTVEIARNLTKETGQTIKPFTITTENGEIQTSPNSAEIISFAVEKFHPDIFIDDILNIDEEMMNKFLLMSYYSFGEL
uniref:Uncharacterized protein n=1 Tax=Acrobeloides nanus TaxID=290746 RepID=A0A914CHT2_9BILA